VKDKNKPGDRKAKPVVSRRKHTKEIAERNKARRLAKYNKWLLKRQIKNRGKPKKPKAMSKRLRQGSNDQKGDELNELRFHTILFRDDKAGKKTVVEGLTIEDSNPSGWHNVDPEREGGVMFRTAKGKPWFVQFKEFSFVFNYVRPVFVAKQTAQVAPVDDEAKPMEAPAAD
jgi:hypothetical protein